MANTDEKAEKGAQNQALFREINERIKTISDQDRIPPEELWDFICECCDTGCIAMISLTYAEYEAIRRVPTRFPVAAGHFDPEIEQLVEQNERFTVVEKFGEAGITAAKLDPRREGVEVS